MENTQTYLDVFPAQTPLSNDSKDKQLFEELTHEFDDEIDKVAVSTDVEETRNVTSDMTVEIAPVQPPDCTSDVTVIIQANAKDDVLPILPIPNPNQISPSEPWLSLPLSLHLRTQSVWSDILTFGEKHKKLAKANETYETWLIGAGWDKWGCTEGIVGMVMDWEEINHDKEALLGSAGTVVIGKAEAPSTPSKAMKGLSFNTPIKRRREEDVVEKKEKLFLDDNNDNDEEGKDDALPYRRLEKQTPVRSARLSQYRKQTDDDDYVRSEAGSDSESDNPADEFHPSSSEDEHQPSPSKKSRSTPYVSKPLKRDSSSSTPQSGKPSTNKIRGPVGGGLPWRSAQKWAMCEEIKDAGIVARNWEDIMIEVNTAGGALKKAKAKTRVQSAFRETHWANFQKLNPQTQSSTSTTDFHYPKLTVPNSNIATAWSTEQITAVWAGVMGRGAEMVVWKKVQERVSKLGPQREAESCRKTWDDTMAKHFGLPGRIRPAKRRQR